MTKEQAEAFVEETSKLTDAEIARLPESELKKLEQAVEILGEGRITFAELVSKIMARVGPAVKTAGRVVAPGVEEGLKLEVRVAEALADLDWGKVGPALAQTARAQAAPKIPSDDPFWKASILTGRVVDAMADADLLPQPYIPPEAVPSKPVKAATARAQEARGEIVDLPTGLLARLYQAADRIGASHADVREVIDKAQEQVSGKMTMPDGMVVDRADGEDAQFTVEDILDAVIADWQSGAIGVPEGFVAARRTTPDPSFFMGRPELGAIPEATSEILPRYFDGDQFNFAGRPPEEIAALQKRLVATGLMDDGDFWSGVWDDSTAMVMKGILGMANQSGVTWDEKIEELAANVPQSVKDERARKLAAKVYQAPPFIAPDPAGLAEDVKSLARQKLGRELRPDEFAAMVQAYGGAHKAAYDARVAAERVLFEQQQGVTQAQLAAGGVQGATSGLVDVDPVARLTQEFDRRFAPDLRFIEDQAAAFENSQNFFRSIGVIDALISGRR